MQRDIILTKDGSHSITVPGMNVTYHSVHGAIQESLHVFIEAGLKNTPWPGSGQPVRILEMGLGTGLNVLLTLIEAEKREQPIHYTALELFPLTPDHLSALNYCEQLRREDLQPLFNQLHHAPWEQETVISAYFTLLKTYSDLVAFAPVLTADTLYQLVYFDAFAPGAQPELWTTAIFSTLFALIAPGGLLVTYCSKGDVRRAMLSAGFAVEKIPGPPGKREMLRARKPVH
ncbi:MAG: tRNA (5-methylaminomethyl-2-thiouridine)(34)-methyltransferase MnmD [Chitinophagaceae bacterium]